MLIHYIHQAGSPSPFVRMRHEDTGVAASLRQYGTEAVAAPSSSYSPPPSPPAGGAGDNTRRPDPSAAAAASHFPLSEAPVVEVVPTRVLRTGAIVPTYIEAPLRAKPPDHDYLSPAEAAEEEELRLALYAAVADRLAGALLVLEGEVMEHRRARGYVEPRPMK